MLSMCKYPLRGGDENRQRLSGVECMPLTLQLQEGFIFLLRWKELWWIHLAALQTCPNLPDPQGVHAPAATPGYVSKTLSYCFGKLKRQVIFFPPGFWSFSFSLSHSLHMPLPTNA